jgi:hypothetical protein
LDRVGPFLFQMACGVWLRFLARPMISLRHFFCRELDPRGPEREARHFGRWEWFRGIDSQIHAASQIWAILSGSGITEGCSPNLTIGPEIVRPHLRRDGGLEIVDRTK